MPIVDNKSIEQHRKVGHLLLTGVPGWLTSALLDSIVAFPPNGLSSIRCFIQRGVPFDQIAFRRQYPLDLEIVEGDLRDKDSLAMAVGGIDTVLHAAAILHVRHPREWYVINSDGTRALAEVAAKNNVGRFVFVSSNAAAGRSDSFDHLMVETDRPNPLSHYGKSKWLAEQAVNSLNGAMEIVVLRPCMFYGPPVPPRHIDVYQRLLHSKMPLVGDGHFARSLSHIDNLVQGCRLAWVHSAAAGQTYYIADRSAYTTKQVTEAMAEALGIKVRFLRLPRIISPLAYRLDLALASAGVYWQTLHLVGESDWHVGVSCAKAFRELGYDPHMELMSGMKQAVEWCRSKGLVEAQ